MIACSQEETGLKTQAENAPTSRFHRISLNVAKQRLMNYITKSNISTRSTEPEIVEVFPLTISIDSNASGGFQDIDTLSADNPDNHYEEILEYAYVFNFAKDGGFAIMSALEELPDMIAYSENGNIPDPSTEMSDAPRNPMVDIYIKELALFAEVKLAYGDDDSDEDIIYKTEYTQWQERPDMEILGLCHVKWHQDAPYNKYFPIVPGTTNKRYKVGCVPIAIAQQMSCFRYPKRYNGIEFDWDAMANNGVILSQAIEGSDMVAKLLFEVAKPENLNVIYMSEDQTGAWMKDIPRTLSNFGYSSPGDLQTFDDDKQGHLVRQELADNAAVIFGGYNNVNNIKIGHTWLVHGMRMSTRTKTMYYKSGKITKKTEYHYLYLTNWGYGGDHDGFFEGANFNPYKDEPNLDEKIKEKSRYKDLQFIIGTRP